MGKRISLDRLRDISRTRAIRTQRLIETESAADCCAMANVEWPIPSSTHR
jgi:hypothetical protein